MFTGIVEETGTIVSFTQATAADAWELVVSARLALKDVALGDSIAVNGCCLTVTRWEGADEGAQGTKGDACAGGGRVYFDVLEQTRRVTSIGQLAQTAGAAVNLERALRFDGKIGGHFVTGHIDGLGTVEAMEQRGADFYLRVRAPEGCGRYLLAKGSVTIDGVALTVAEVEGDVFAAWLIPTTVELTNLQHRRAGDAVNLEFDLLGKYVEKLTAFRRS